MACVILLKVQKTRRYDSWWVVLEDQVLVEV